MIPLEWVGVCQVIDIFLPPLDILLGVPGADDANNKK